MFLTDKSAKMKRRRKGDAAKVLKDVQLKDLGTQFSRLYSKNVRDYSSFK